MHGGDRAPHQHGSGDFLPKPLGLPLAAELKGNPKPGEGSPYRDAD